MFSIMLFIFLCFFGILAVLVYMLRCQDRLVRQLHEEHAQLRLLLRAMESRLDYLDGSPPAASLSDADDPEEQRILTDSSPLAETEMDMDMDLNPHENAYHPARATKLTARSADAVHNPGLDPLMHLSFDPPAGKGQEARENISPAVDPALDLHFDPMDLAQGTARR
ncbi:MAG: hypothetical protein PHI96_08610 [Desulfovibrio sp.]|nr:hypothetical protein [Desulfovibrio sp.]